MAPPPTEDALPQVTLRIPGAWSDPKALVDGLPEGFRLTPEHLILPDGEKVEFAPLQPDTEFYDVFRTACGRPPSEADLEIVRQYRVNVCLIGPGGSYESAKRMLDAAAAIVRAGAGGVFIDNAAIAHGADDWLDLADSNDPGGAYWAFIATVKSEREVYSLGAHVLGLRDAVAPRTEDDEFDHFIIHNFLGYTYQSGQTVNDGDLLGDEESAMFQVRREPFTRFPPGSPLHNPYGQWRLQPVDAHAN